MPPTPSSVPSRSLMPPGQGPANGSTATCWRCAGRDCPTPRRGACRRCPRVSSAAVIACWRMADSSLLTIAGNLGPSRPRYRGIAAVYCSQAPMRRRRRRNRAGSDQIRRWPCWNRHERAAVREFAGRAGLAVEWRDYANEQHRVSAENLRRILAALQLPCDTAADLAQSRRRLETSRLPPLITATTGHPFEVPTAGKVPDRVRVTYEDGTIAELPVRSALHGVRLPGIETPGYHVSELGAERITVAVAPPRCFTIEDIHQRSARGGSRRRSTACAAPAIAASANAGVVASCRQGAGLRADAVALSPVHACLLPIQTISARIRRRAGSSSIRFSRRAILFGDARVAKAAHDAGVAAAAAELEPRLIDWRESARAKMSVFRRLFDDFSSTDLAARAAMPLAADFAQFRAAGGALLAAHAQFEALHAARFAADGSAWNWRDWSEAGATRQARK